MATHSSILAWEIPWTEEPGGLQSMRSQKCWTQLTDYTTTTTLEKSCKKGTKSSPHPSSPTANTVTAAMLFSRPSSRSCAEMHTHTHTHTHTHLRVRYRHAPSALNISMLTHKNNDVHSTTRGITSLSENQKAKSDLQLERKWCTETLPFNCLDILCLCCIRFPFKLNIRLYGKISGLNTKTSRKAANE